MLSFGESQLISLMEDLRLLEAFVADTDEATAPLDLSSDFRMLRQSLQIPQATKPSQGETQYWRAGFEGLMDDLALVVIEKLDQVESKLTIVSSGKNSSQSPINDEWLTKAGLVVKRAREAIAGRSRSKTAERISGLYVIVDPGTTRGRRVERVTEGILRGGANVVQFRDKITDSANVLETARILKSMCAEHDAVFVMNDDSALALASAADALHVGQTDLPVADVRRVLTDSQLVGRSNNNMKDVEDSVAAGVDYLAVGAVFATVTMGKNHRTPVGPSMIAEVKEFVSQPIVAIGGINHNNVAEVVRAGADCICVVSAVTMADDPEAATRSMVNAIEKATAQVST